MTDEILKNVNINSSVDRNPPKIGWIGIALASITGGTAVALSVIAAPFVAPALRKVCLPYVPASTKQVENVLSALKAKSCIGKSLIDLGSGDGRLVIAASKTYNLTSTGVELNPWLILYSRYKAWREGVYNSTSFKKQDLWTLNLSKFDNVVLFGVQEMMQDMEEKFTKELPNNCTVIACRFPLPSWSPCLTIGEGIDAVWVYKNTSSD